MKNKIEVAIGDKKIVAFVNDWKDDMPKEIYISLVDRDDVIIQDICMVREHYHYNRKSEDFEIDSSLIDCRVWAYSNNEDYTDEFCISVYEEEE